MLANCLHDDHIFAGQILYVPCLPIKTPTSTPSITPTETETPSTETNHPPKVTITNPPSDTFYIFYYDPDLSPGKRLFANVLLQGKATDPEDGELYDSSLKWATDQTEFHANPTLGTGNELKVILYSNSCEDVSHTITLTATDKDGNQSKATRSIAVICEY
jgi:hypothetical protein